LEAAEEVTPVTEHPFLDPVLDAPECERRFVLLLVPGQFLAKPGHGAVEVMELEAVAGPDLVVGPPLVGGPVTAGGEEAMEDGEEDRPLDIELEAASLQELLDNVAAAGLVPEPLEDQGGSDASGGDGGELPLGMSREEENGLGEAGARDQEGVELTGLLELVESAECGDDPLAWSTVLPAVLDDLEVGACAGFLGAEEHSAPVVEAP
jgi:hypothetical protein